MYRSVIIDKNNIDTYRDMIPDLFADELLADELKGVAVMDEAREKNNLMGVILLRRWNGWVELVRITLSKAYETNDYGADLIWNVTEFCRGWEIFRGVYATIYPEDEGQLEYYRMAGFRIEDDLSNVMEFTLGDIPTDGPLSGRKGEDKCMSLAESTVPIREELNIMLKNADEPLPIDLPVDFDKYDQDYSTIYDDGDTKALILVRKTDIGMVVDFAYSPNPVALIPALSSLYRWAKLILDDDQKILVPVLSWKTAELTKKLVPAATRSPRKLAVREYEIKRK